MVGYHKQMNLAKMIGIVLVLIVVLNLVFYALRWISATLFWAMIVVMAVIAYVIIPRLHHNNL